MNMYWTELRQAQGLLMAYAAILADRETLSPKKSQILRQAEQASRYIDQAIEAAQCQCDENEKLRHEPKAANDQAKAEIHSLQRILLNSRHTENELRKRIALLEERLDAAYGTAANEPVETVPLRCDCWVDLGGGNGQCNGTRELDLVNCGGDSSKCIYRRTDGTGSGTQGGLNDGSQEGTQS